MNIDYRGNQFHPRGNPATGMHSIPAVLPQVLSSKTRDSRDYCGITAVPITVQGSIVDTCLSCEDIARQSCAMVPRWRLVGDFLGPVFPASQDISDLHSKFALGPHHVSKKKKERKIETTGQKYNGLPYYVGRP